MCKAKGEKRMNWQSCFEKYKYKSLISEDKNENEKILMEMFYEDGKLSLIHI